MGASDPPLHRFGHEAMNTPFEIAIAGQDETYASQAAMAVFRQVDRIEGILSRFNPCSDVGQINLLEVGQSVGVELDVLNCLLVANEVHCQTGGAFDVTVGPLVQCKRDDEGHPVNATQDQWDAALARVGMDRLILNFEDFTVGVKKNWGRYPIFPAREHARSQDEENRVASPVFPVFPVFGRVVVDLGGIGKGFALDCVVETLDDWGIDNAMIHGGTSTALVTGSGGTAAGCPPGVAGWVMGIGADWGAAVGLERIILHSGAVSGSGVELQGEHIIDPRTGVPALTHLAAWAVCPSAARADALSTAFVVMSTGEVEAYCDCHEDTAAVVVPRRPAGSEDEAELISFGLDKLEAVTLFDRA